MANEPREEQSGGKPENSPRAAAEQRPPDRPQGGDSDAPQPFPDRRAPARTGSEDERHKREVWKEYARLKFGVSPHAVAGALAHHDPDEEIGFGVVQEALGRFSARRGAE